MTRFTSRPVDELAIHALTTVLREARSYVARPGNDFAWSSWSDAEDALAEIDRMLARLAVGKLPRRGALELMVTVSGAMQELAMSSGWGEEFLGVAARMDAAITRAYR